jgi:hypothetical protein
VLGQAEAEARAEGVTVTLSVGILPLAVTVKDGVTLAVLLPLLHRVAVGLTESVLPPPPPLLPLTLGLGLLVPRGALPVGLTLAQALTVGLMELDTLWLGEELTERVVMPVREMAGEPVTERLPLGVGVLLPPPSSVGVGGADSEPRVVLEWEGLGLAEGLRDRLAVTHAVGVKLGERERASEDRPTER